MIVLFAVVGLWQSFGANGDVMWPLALWASAGVAVVTGLHAWRKPRWSLAAILIVVGACESWSLLKIVPRFDSYRDQASFAARIVDRVGSAPIHVPLIRPTPGVPLALPENQIAYYLPLTVRLLDIESDAEWVLAPARMQSTLHGFVAVDRCVSLRFLMTEGDRLTLFRKAAATAAPKRTAHAWMR